MPPAPSTAAARHHTPRPAHAVAPRGRAPRGRPSPQPRAQRLADQAVPDLRLDHAVGDPGAPQCRRLRDRQLRGLARPDDRPGPGAVDRHHRRRPARVGARCRARRCHSGRWPRTGPRTAWPPTRTRWPVSTRSATSGRPSRRPSHALPHQMQSRIRWWIADPTGVPHIVPGSSATQWYWGSSYDITTAAPRF